MVETSQDQRLGVVELCATRGDLLGQGTLPPVLVVPADEFTRHPVALQDAPAITVLPESALPAGVTVAEAERVVAMVVADADVGTLVQAIDLNPDACRIMVDLVRASQQLPVEQALVMESLAYSLLQTGREYTDWVRGRERQVPQAGRDPQVLVGENDNGILIELNRPLQANALGMLMRHELVQAFAALRHTDAPITWSGRGRHFCAGGDLDDFGAVADPVHTHRLRTVQGLPREVAAVGPRLTVRTHGASVGAGVELLAFASRVEATAGATFRLPEAAMGLLPGCGGTVSLPRRIGRSRALLMMLTGMTVDATRALEWGLIDEVLQCP